jgi:hypothetical protein
MFLPRCRIAHRSTSEPRFFVSAPDVRQVRVEHGSANLTSWQIAAMGLSSSTTGLAVPDSDTGR